MYIHTFYKSILYLEHFITRAYKCHSIDKEQGIVASHSDNFTQLCQQLDPPNSTELLPSSQRTLPLTEHCVIHEDLQHDQVKLFVRIDQFHHGRISQRFIRNRLPKSVRLLNAVQGSHLRKVQHVRSQRWNYRSERAMI